MYVQHPVCIVRCGVGDTSFSPGPSLWVVWSQSEKQQQNDWLTAPLCLMCSIWRERNKRSFEVEELLLHRLKVPILILLFIWMKEVIADSLDSFVSFLQVIILIFCWRLYVSIFFYSFQQAGEGMSVIFGALYIPCVLSPLGAFSFIQYILTLIKKMKKIQKSRRRCETLPEYLYGFLWSYCQRALMADQLDIVGNVKTYF